MTFNKNQKIVTIIYCIFLVLILLFLTPYAIYNRFGLDQIKFGNLFIIEHKIVYPKLFIEIVVLTIIYCLSVLMLNKK